jgi:hypothetical protein
MTKGIINESRLKAGRIYRLYEVKFHPLGEKPQKTAAGFSFYGRSEIYQRQLAVGYRVSLHTSFRGFEIQRYSPESKETVY